MKLEILTPDQQLDGQFNGGEILEKRPVVMSNSGKSFTPYSNLFYWAHAWSDSGSTIGEHPHQGFEILSFVLKGGIEHYDSAHEGWKQLEAGDMQVIKSGSGISHSERLLPGASMFQIWFDPNLQTAIQKAATYSDHRSSEFKSKTIGGVTEVVYVGEGSPVKLDSQGVEIKKLLAAPGSHDINIDESSTASIFVVSGSFSSGENTFKAGDFIRFESAGNWKFINDKEVEIFMIQTPSTPAYPTYARMFAKGQ